ncbi:DNA-directed RNA polymerases I and III subunit RPAC1-like isoform X1 [Leptotrombidium deliense]|uniref:DNA-directed RNA polymerases I and III subunit RPAC1 n=1 Tax=Leptotrombidium deliense TaxID=299467 RepID=A0A443SS07_9ACAR|nr:DNA-directed RNA polymerases I and III subunit RPAC1-like isoform X1 [Leptotrombidium deliense]
MDAHTNEAVLKEYEIENFDDSWNFENFKEKFSIVIQRVDRNCLEFDMIHINAAITNALRRILISEVPTLAIEKVFVYNNTSLLQDDFLAHRLGLIPIKVDPRYFEYRQEGDIEGTPQDTVVFDLKVKCVKNSNAETDASTPEKMYINRHVYSGQFKWLPIGSQAEMFREKPIKPVDDDILIAKLSPGQELDLKLHCVKGIGRDHIKFSPVATAFYRLLPKIELTKKVKGEDIERLKQCFSKGVIGVKYEGEEGEREEVATVIDSRLDSCGRNVFRHKHLKDSVKMSVIKDHFIFSVESTGALPSNTLFLEATKILTAKCRHFLGELEEINNKIKK